MKHAVTGLGANPPDPNSELGGVPARGRVTKIGNHYVSGDTSLNRRDGRWVADEQVARWNFHKVWVVADGASADMPTEVHCYLARPAHRALRPGIEVPLRVDAGSGAVLGLDVAAWEAEVDAASPQGQGPI